MSPALVEFGEFDAARFMQAWAEHLAQSPKVADAAHPSHWHVRAWSAHPLDVRTLPPPLAQAAWGLLPGWHRLRLRAASHPHVHTHLTLGIGPDAARASQNPTPPPLPTVPDREASVVVLGAGLAGAACARALAERGYRVLVLDAATAPAAGASGLPVGLVAPHASPDDSVISRLSRAGVRAMRDALQQLLKEGEDWGDTGVQERRLPGKTRKGGAPASWALEWPTQGQDWTCAATAAGLPPHTLWHAHGAWVRPARLVHALLQHPQIQWQAHAHATHLQRNGHNWQVMQGTQTLAQGAQLVLACGPATPRLLQASGLDAHAAPIRPLRGQLSWGLMSSLPPEAHAALPATPVNGHGCFVHGLSTDDGPAWFAGSTFDRERDTPELLDTDHDENCARVQALLPELATALASPFAHGQVRGWAAVRCSVPDRLPMVGRVPHAPEGLWLCSAMGSRGLSLSVLCGELLAAQWTGEPLPMEPALARALSSLRFIKS